MKSKKGKSPPARFSAKNQSSVQVAEQRAFSGPIPPPEALERYAAINPDLVNRIMALAE